MAASEDAIDHLYQGPLEAFTDARNQLAKSAKQPELKKLEKPSLPAWVVNQLHWHHRAVLAKVEDAAAALLEQHQLLLAGKTAAIARAEQTHREAVRAALTVAREVLTAGGHPDTAATMDAVRNTLQALPSPEAQGRLTRPLAPRGLEALAGLMVSARPGASPSRPTSRPVTPAEPATRDEEADSGAAARRREAARFTAKADAERARKQAQEEAKRRAEEERAEREREARRAAAEQAVADAEAAVAAAEQDVAAARAAVTAADRAFADAMAARDKAKMALADAKRKARDIS